MKPKLTLLFLLAGAIPLLVMGVRSDMLTTDEIREGVLEKLAVVRDIKRRQMEAFFEERKADMGALVKTSAMFRKTAAEMLAAARDGRRLAVERYFRRLEDQMIAFSEEGRVSAAMGPLREAFRAFRAERHPDRGEWERARGDLLDFYKNEFTRERRKRSPGRGPDADAFFESLDERAAALQSHYVRAGANPSGSDGPPPPGTGENRLRKDSRPPPSLHQQASGAIRIARHPPG
ncbi:MAG: hypothetical protein GY859_09750 [Desulfobacterales bacterium]|nr:hypothetical protein [Desulfobacterales bacterium]